ncbi:hypothetical protein vseg_020260 [Gypsophila vaccaria]
MASFGASMLLPSKINEDHQFVNSFSRFSRSSSKKNTSVSPMMRLFGPAIFEASKLKVLFLGVDEGKHAPKLPRTYTLTHSDITSKLTLAISQSINISQLEGWYNKLQRDEVVAEWKKVKGKMSLHVHCHISGGHFLLDLCAWLRFYIFRKELPVVLKAFVHGDVNLFSRHPELQTASVWVYFHSNIPEFNKVECWGPLQEAASPTTSIKTSLTKHEVEEEEEKGEEHSLEEPCKEACVCCFPTTSSIPWVHSLQTQPPKENVSLQGLEQRS